MVGIKGLNNSFIEIEVFFNLIFMWYLFSLNVSISIDFLSVYKHIFLRLFKHLKN